jgi:hypothetical protein
MKKIDTHQLNSDSGVIRVKQLRHWLKAYESPCQHCLSAARFAFSTSQWLGIEFNFLFFPSVFFFLNFC